MIAIATGPARPAEAWTVVIIDFVLCLPPHVSLIFIRSGEIPLSAGGEGDRGGGGVGD